MADSYGDEIRKAVTPLKAQLSEQAETTQLLRKALEFYANPENYRSIANDGKHWPAWPVIVDEGDRAREVLERLK